MSATADAVAFHIVAAVAGDRPRIEAFLRQHFYRSEPMNMSLGMTSGHHCSDLVLPLESLEEGSSLLAVVGVASSQTIVGVCLNGAELADEEFDFTFTDECSTFRKVVGCVKAVRNNADIFKDTGASRALDVHVLAVDPGFRRAGIGRALLHHTVTVVAKEQGYPLVSCMCTSFYTARITEALGMKCVYSMRYDEYLGDDRRPVFQPPPPHDEIKVYVLAI